MSMSFPPDDRRPAEEPGFALTRVEGKGRQQTYAIRAYVTDRPEGSRYA